MKKAVWVFFLVAFAFTGWRLASVGQSADPSDSTAVPVDIPAFGRFTAILTLPEALWLGDHSGQIVRIKDKAPPLSWVAHSGPIRRLLAHRDHVVSVGGGSIARWSGDGVRMARNRARDYGLNDGLMTDNGAILVATERGMVARLDASDPWRMAGYHGRAAFALALSPDQGKVASGGADGRLAIWSTASSSGPLDSWRSGGRWVIGVGWTPVPDGVSGSPPKKTGLLSATQGGEITLWRWPEPGIEKVIDCGGDELVSFAVDGSRFIAGGESGRICLGDFGDDAPPRRWSVSEHPVMAVAFSGRQIFTSGPPGVVLVWDVTNGALVDTLAPKPSRSTP